MKNYKFKLEAVLKLRKFREEKARIELGELVSYLNKIENQIAYDNREIDTYYLILEKAMGHGVGADRVQIFPALVEAKRANIRQLHIDKKLQERLIEEKKRELATLRGELKVMENLKEKDMEKFKKELEKRINVTIEEQTQNWWQFHEEEV